MTDTYELEIDLDAAPARVWHALTDPVELQQWFCEHAEVDLAAGRFDFWGRHTPGTPTRDEGRGRVVEVDPTRLLRFEWGGTTVTISLDGSTRVRVLQEGVPARPTLAGHLPSHWWGFALGHLRALLATGRPGPRFDWSWPHHGGFTAHADIAAPPATVWDGLVSNWITPDNVRRRPARDDHEDFGFDVGIVVGVKILDLERPARFSLAWIEDRTTVLSYELAGSDGGTHVTIVQSGFDADFDVQGQAEGFFSGVLELAWLLESGGTWRRGGPDTVRVLLDGQHDRRLASERV